MAEPRRIGNRRIFQHGFHRVTKRAYQQLLDALYEAIAAQGIALFGTDPQDRFPGGVLSDWEFQMRVTPTGVTLVFPKPGELGWVSSNGLGGVVQYDPATPGQSDGITVTGYVGSSAPFYVHWRRGEVDADILSEIHWVVPVGEVSTPIETISYEVVEFATSTEISPNDLPRSDGWRILGRVLPGAAPEDFRMEFLPFLDSFFAAQGRWGDLPSVTWPMGPQTPQVVHPQDGLLYMVKRIIDQCYMLSWPDLEIDEYGAVIDESAGIVPWYLRPLVGLAGIESALGSLILLLRRARAAPRVYAVITVTARPIGTPPVGLAFVDATVIWTGYGVGAVSASATASGYLTPPSIAMMTTRVTITTENTVPNAFLLWNVHGYDAIANVDIARDPKAMQPVPAGGSTSLEFEISVPLPGLVPEAVLTLYLMGVG